MEYVISTFRGGTRWAARCVCRAFKLDGKNRRGGSRIPKKEDGIRDAISPSRITESGSRITDKRKIKRCTANDKSNHRELEGRTRSCSVTGNFPRKENPGSLRSASKEGSRDCRCRVRNARCQTSVSNGDVLKKGKVHHAKSTSNHFGGRKKKRGRKKWIVPRTGGYNKTPALLPQRHYQIRDSLELIKLENIIEDIGSGEQTAEEGGKKFPSKFDDGNKTEEPSNRTIDFDQPDENDEEFSETPTIRDPSYGDEIEEH
ncbi:uncharacterized protein LOC125500562 [Athalia rosae]|uniref:uncharacterized protein LOC125500562 n=1 Tax=Athalia rosae TaxID=37344 RepID=UPI002034569A|nr:uncharacterized protein LOC125500562 [Athalia rosae]